MIPRHGMKLALALLGAFLGLAAPVISQEPAAWTDKDTRLATEYLGMLVEKPDDERVLDLLWSLYEKHRQTAFLLQNISAQAEQQTHPGIILIHAQLLRKAGQIDPAIARYRKLLEQQPGNAGALRALFLLFQQKGDLAEALAYLRRFTATLPVSDPRHAEHLLQQGHLLLDLNRREEAAAVCEQAIASRPNDTAFLRTASRFLLGAGMLDQTLALMQRLARETTDPNQKLDALFDLSRLEEQAGHFTNAATALQNGLDLLHDKDWRYTQFFQRLVKLHERFDRLDSLKEQLLAQAAQQPVTEKALSNLARYSLLVVDNDERIKWLRQLVQTFPNALEHRWDLVTALLDHDSPREAAALLDEILKGDGSDRAQLILLRALAHLRVGETSQTISLLRNLLDQQGADPEVEKLVLTFARQKSLDALTQHILQARVQRQPGKTEPLFELATFYRARGNIEATAELFRRFVDSAPPQEKQRRLNEVASFLSAGSDLHQAEQAARRALDTPQAGREELLRLADILTQRSATPEALRLLEQAWTLSQNEEQRVDVDERLAAVLAGDQGGKLLVTPIETTTEFKLPAMFTGEGFGSDAPPSREQSVPESLALYAQAQALGIWLHLHQPVLRTVFLSSPPLLKPVPCFTPPPVQADDNRILRAAWWSIRTGQPDIAISLLQPLTHDSKGQRKPASVELEKLLLVAVFMQVEKNPAPAAAQLRRLAELDPPNRSSYLLRLAELEGRRNGKQGIVEALRILEQLIQDEPDNEAVLTALSQFYLENGQREKALALWDVAARKTTGKSTPLLERYAELLIAQRRFTDYVNTQIRLLEQETDISRRRDVFQRALERLLWADSVQGEIPPEEKKERLESLKSLINERIRRDPFDGFWNEALAYVYEREGDAQQAFNAMKQAYYTAPDTPFSLEQLRLAALRVGDIKSAIYFQKQIAASAASKDEAGEWRHLVQLLESDFRMTEADSARRRLEARFSQDPAALEELARYYTETAQDDAARRVLEQLVRVRGWDPGNLFRLALQQKKLGEHDAARATLRRILTTIPAPPRPGQEIQPERWPWPLLDERHGGAFTPGMLLSSLENAPGLDQEERERLRLFLSLPRPEFYELPDETQPVRLRAIEEYIRLSPPAGAEPLPPLGEIEQIWADYYSGNTQALQQQLQRHLQGRQTLEAQFVRLWLGLKAHQMDSVLAWVREPNQSEFRFRQRRGLFQAVVNILADDQAFYFTAAEVSALGRARLLSTTEVIDIARKFESRSEHFLALTLTEALRQSSPGAPQDFNLFLARLAEVEGNSSLQRHYLHEVWKKPIEAGKPNAFDPFFQCFARLWQLLPTAGEREQLLQQTWQRLNQLPPSGQGELRKARLLGLVGASEASEQRLTRFLGASFLTTRGFAESTVGRLVPGALPGSHGAGENNHLRSYWEDLREWEDLLSTDGLTPSLTVVDQAIARRNAGVPLGPEANYEYNAWRNQVLLRQIRYASHPERQRLLREFLQSDESVQTMLELGGFLESKGYSRECIEVYSRLPERAPSNTEYGEQFLRVCETSHECAIGIDYIEKLFVAEVHFRPQGIKDETLREKHARFLAWQQNLPRLRALGYLENPTARILQDRVPEQVPYLKELAFMFEARKDQPGALAAWEEMHRLWPNDIEGNLHRARLLHAQGNATRALAALREIPLSNFWSDPVREAFALRAQLVAEAGLWDEMRALMNTVTGGPGPGLAPPSNTLAPSLSSRQGGSTFTGGVLVLSRVLASHHRESEAHSLLLRAERSVKEDRDRFKLRLEQLRLTAASPSWSPAADHSRLGSLFRTAHDDPETLDSLVTFLALEADGARARAWVAALLQPDMPANTITALALSCFINHLSEDQFPRVVTPWTRTRDAAWENARELAVRTLLNQQKAPLAHAVAIAGEKHRFAESPHIIPVLAALGDRHGLEELFSRLVRLTFPGSSDVTPYANAFALAGRSDLAGELYDLALQRLRDLGAVQPNLIENHARFLLSQHRYEKAENLLLHEHHGMVEELPPLLVDLYRGWNKLDQLESQLAKFYLPDGLIHETLFLASEPPPSS